MVPRFLIWGFPGGVVAKNLAASAGDGGDMGLIPGLGRCSAPVFLPGEFHGQRSLAGYHTWDHKESDTTE